MPLRLLDSLQDIAAGDWNALQDVGNPFVSHAFLSGLEQHGCLKPSLGWAPRHALLFEDDRLVAAASAYLKGNSHGEFVFDHAWAHAYAQHGFAYYPKWLVAVPYSPVTGPRLLARDNAARTRLAEAMRERAEDDGLSSLHLNFIDEREEAAFDGRWAARSDVQFHWQNRGWACFDDFLGALSSKKRKNLRAEREQVRRSGVTFRVLHGDEATGDDIRAMHDFYCLTQTDKGNRPALTLAFFQHLATSMPRQLVLVLAARDGRTVAGALCVRNQNTLYGRYWGSTDPLPGLHFETCYYQGIEYCLREKLASFEPGAQGEHKLARGFLPTLTRSRHHLSDPRFAEAVAEWCRQETESVLRYRELILRHSPFRDDGDAASNPRA